MRRSRVALETTGAASVVALLFVALSAKSALACSVCFIAEEETRVAFIVTAGLLTFLPLAFVGSVVWWLYDKARKLEREEAEAVAAER